MSEPGSAAAPSALAQSAGEMLRSARQAQGLHIAALSAAIKVSQRKLELLEADRLSELPDATFARALAQTICRSLKIDPAPVLAALPQAPGYRLDTVDGGINTPFRERPGRQEPARFAALASPTMAVSALIVVAALVVLLMPADWVSSIQGAWSGAPPAPVVAEVPAVPVADPSPAAPAPVDAALAASAVLPAMGVEAAASGASVETVHSAPDAVSASEGAASGVAVGPLQFRASEETWVEVVDGRSQVLVSRMLLPGEAVVLDGVTPFKVKVGNAAGTEIAFRGQIINLSPATRDNVARLELK